MSVIDRLKSAKETAEEKVRDRRRKQFTDARAQAIRDRARREEAARARKKAQRKLEREIRQEMTNEEVAKLRAELDEADSQGRRSLRDVLAGAVSGFEVSGGGGMTGGGSRRAPSSADETARNAADAATMRGPVDASLDPVTSPEDVNRMATGEETFAGNLLAFDDALGMGQGGVDGSGGAEKSEDSLEVLDVLGLSSGGDKSDDGDPEMTDDGDPLAFDSGGWL